MAAEPLWKKVDFDSLPGVPCPCGSAKRAFADVTDYPATVHVTEISADAKLHYHRRQTETYYILECDADARLQLDQDVIAVKPGTCVMIPPNVRHRAIGRMKIMNIVIPKFDVADEFLEADASVRWPVQEVAIGNQSLRLVDQGNGIPLVCLHGFPLNHTMWHEQIAGLSDRFRVIAPDLRGFGHSRCDFSATDELSMEQLADDVARMLDALSINEPIVLCGLSMGGYVAWQFWKKYASRLRGLVLCDTRAVADTSDGVANRHRLASMVLENGPTVVSSAMLPNLLATTTNTNRPDIVSLLRETIHETPAKTIAAALRGLARRPDVRSWLPQINVPSLLIVGEEDKISTVAEMREMCAAIPGAQIVVVPDSGHMAPLENPSVVNAAIRDFVR